MRPPHFQPEVTTVKAKTDIPQGTTLGPFAGEFCLGTTSSDTRSVSIVLEVVFSDGRLTVEGDEDTAFLWYIQPARDRHEQNLEAIRDNNLGHIFYKSIRKIREGEELLVWYGDELARESDIPVLTPDNIRGNQQYTCTKCMKSFLYPNTLKAHMKYHCPQNNHVGIPAVPSLLYPAKLLDLQMGQDKQMPKQASLGVHGPTGAKWVNPMGPANLNAHFGGMSAFKPHRRHLEEDKLSSPKREKCESKCCRKSPEHDSNPGFRKIENVSKPRHDAKTITERLDSIPRTVPSSSSQPIQIFNHIHPPAALPLPLGHDALRLYYPLYQRLYGNQAFCCGPLPAAGCHPMPGSYPLDPGMFFPVGFQRHFQAPRETIDPAHIQKVTHQNKNDSTARIHPSLQPASSAFPLPSEKAGEPLDLLPRSLYMNKSRKGHLCIYCGKLYSRKYGLKIHLRTHTGYKPLKCKVCLRPFGDPSNLNKHIRLHAEGDTPYRCDYCGKVLVRRRDLERHIKSRHPNEAIQLENKKQEQLNAAITDIRTSDVDAEDEDEEEEFEENIIVDDDSSIDYNVNNCKRELGEEVDLETRDIEVV